MNQRQIDLALLAGIGVLLIAILVLALSAAPMRGGSADNPPGAEQTADNAATPLEDAPGNQAEQPAGETAQNEPAEVSGEDAPSEEVSAVDVTPDETNIDETSTDTSAEENVEDSAAQAEGGASEDAAQVDAAPTEANAEEAQAGETAQTEASTSSEEVPAPVGAVNLNRVGFAFITAESGACSIPLQPWRQVAVSRDLLAQYGCGATVTLDLADTVNGNQQVTAQIADTMNPSFERTVNIFVGEEEPALEYGVTTGTLQSAPQ